VVLKAGSSALSARTAAAHTGALVGDDRVIDAIFADLGVIRVDSIEDMLITAGVRGAAPADLDALAVVIARIGDLALALGGDLESLEVNPLLVDGARIEALDAVVTWTTKGED
jgi:acetate---CoA ligase (ADP-forming)